jgi:hypothetical protein
MKQALEVLPQTAARSMQQRLHTLTEGDGMGFLHGVSHRGIIEAYYSLHQARRPSPFPASALNSSPL